MQRKATRALHTKCWGGQALRPGTGIAVSPLWVGCEPMKNTNCVNKQIAGDANCIRHPRTARVLSFAISLVGLVTACSTSINLPTPSADCELQAAVLPAGSLWSQSQLTAQSQACFTGGRTSGQSCSVDQRLTRYCNCFYQSLSTRMTFFTYMQDPASAEALLDNDGTEAQCSTQASREFRENSP